MYIELFLLDNALMNMLICRLAAALCGRRVHGLRAGLFALGGAVYAALAFLYAPFMSLPAKLAMCLAMGLALPFRGVWGYLTGTVAMFASACIIGGLAFFMAYATGGAVEGGMATGGITLRAMLIIASAAAAMPSVARRMGNRARAQAGLDELELWVGGRRYEVLAMVDSGNTLMEPASGLPAIVVHLPELEDMARIPIPANTVGGEALLYAIRPERAEYGGEELDAVVALSPRPVYPGALIPPSVLPRGLGPEAGYNNATGGVQSARTHTFPNIPAVQEPWRRRTLHQQRRGPAPATHQGGGGGADGGADKGQRRGQDHPDRAEPEACGVHSPQV